MGRKVALAAGAWGWLSITLACFDPLTSESDSGWDTGYTADTHECSTAWTCAYDGQATPMCEWACVHEGSERAETCSVLASMLESGDPGECCSVCR